MFRIFFVDILVALAVVLNVFDFGSDETNLVSNGMTCKLATCALYFVFQFKFLTIVSVVFTLSFLVKCVDVR